TTKTINRKFSTLRTFFLFLKRENKIKTNPTKKVIAPKIGKRLPSIIQKKEINDLLGNTWFSNNFFGVRDKTIIVILYNTGMRRAELINLKDNDFDFYNKTLKVLGKGNKERIIPMTDELVESIKFYFEKRNDYFERNDFLNTLVTDKGNKLYPKFVYNTVNKYLNIVSTVEKKSPHILRHSLATHLADEEVELNAIKTLLGHANLSTTQIYTHNSIEKLKRAYKKAHPKAK
ncbi:MAG TPA: integrase, partial [Bacteroidetes bacterium]|nr:integrase [Bacteroidota bacterium]